MELTKEEMAQIKSSNPEFSLSRARASVGPDIDIKNPEHRQRVIDEMQKALKQVESGDCEIVDIDKGIEPKSLEDFLK